MTRWRRPIALVPFALVMLLASCGGGKSSKETVNVAGATGPSGPSSSTQRPNRTPTAPRPSTTRGAKKAQGKNGTRKRNGQSGGASPSAPSSPSSPSSPASKNSAIEQLKRKAAALEKKLNKNGKKNKKKGGSTPSKLTPPPKPSDKPQEVLARKAKRVCETVGIDNLAKRYKVAPTAEAVATAYAASYPPTLRAAIHDGCKSAFPGQ